MVGHNALFRTGEAGSLSPYPRRQPFLHRRVSTGFNPGRSLATTGDVQARATVGFQRQISVWPPAFCRESAGKSP